MKIINAQSSVPSNEDNLIMYSGTYTGTTTPLDVIVQTTARYTFYATFVARRQYSPANPPVADAQLVNLGYVKGANANSQVNYTVSIPKDYILEYFIIGTLSLNTPRHPELGTPADGSNKAYVGKYKALIKTDGTISAELVNNTGLTITPSKGSTGVYILTASDNLFLANKVLVSCIIEGTESSYASSYDMLWGRVSDTVVKIWIHLDGALADAIGVIGVTIEIFP